MSPADAMQITVDSRFDGRTVKDWLYQNGISRTLITRLKKREDGIRLNGCHATVRAILHTGDTLTLADDDRAEDENEFLTPTPMPLDILYEDEDCMALNKPAGMPTHPSHDHRTDTLANGLCALFADRGIPFVFRAVNRLDRDTSGVVLIAKSQASAARLSALMKAGQIQKTYLAVLNGCPDPPAGRIDAPIRRKPYSTMLREVCAPKDGQDALTEYRTAAASPLGAIVLAEPITGRTHQLRVHFAHIGCPIAGDGLYGSAESDPTIPDRAISRQALHALSLKIGERTIRAPLPADILAAARTIDQTFERNG